jgi:hypothetical protein
MRSLRISLARLSLQTIGVLILLNPRIVEAGCFHPNGTQTTDLYHAPCSNDISNPLSTICCAVERANPAQGLSTDGFSRDICLDNGICQNSWRVNRTDPKVYTSYWREECTVQDWRSGKCLSVCVNEVCIVKKPRIKRTLEHADIVIDQQGECRNDTLWRRPEIGTMVLRQFGFVLR